MTDAIDDTLKSLPQRPGVYRMIVRFAREAQAAGFEKYGLGDILGRSQSSLGALQASQAGNELAALGVKQALQLQTLIAAQYRAKPHAGIGGQFNSPNDLRAVRHPSAVGHHRLLVIQ